MSSGARPRSSAILRLANVVVPQESNIHRPSLVASTTRR